jgi:outer membrane protein assembly factor BamA
MVHRFLLVGGLLCHAPLLAQDASDSLDHHRQGVEFLPLLSYDTDTGVGYGVKLFLFDRLSATESFDIILFQSTKGERSYSVAASFPDLETRQRTIYPIALDVFAEYNRSKSANYFGTGIASGGRETYTRTPIEVRLTASRGFTPAVVGQFIVRYGAITNSNISPTGRLAALGGKSIGRITFAAMGLSFRYDTRNSFINPSSGIVVRMDGSRAPQWTRGTLSFSRVGGAFQLYVPVHGIVLAGRLGMEQISGTDLPVQALLSLGGANTLRGYSQDRFLDKARCVVNLEARMTIVWRIGAVAGWDAGNVWDSLGKLGVAHWVSNPTVGVRLLMDNFVARLDVGFSSETTGLYLNFGQLF